MEDGLSAILVAIDNHPIPILGNTMLTSQSCRGCHDMAEKVYILDLIERSQMSLRHYQ